MTPTLMSKVCKMACTDLILKQISSFLEKAREVMEMVETARIWYIDSGANVTFQLFGPIFGSLLLAICKELTRKTNISPNMFIISVAYMLWQQLPGILSSFASAMANVGAAGLQDSC